MSIHVHELKDLKMYNAKNNLIVPLSENDNKKESVIHLITPNIESSINIMKSDIIINRNWFKSYYLEKSINVILNGDNTVKGIKEDTDSFIDGISMMLLEDKIDTKTRNKLKASDFGIPSKRQYPINDEEHVRAAIRMFNHVSKEDEETLAKNIIKKIDKFEMTDIEIGEDNRLYSYYSVVKESNFEFRDYACYSFNKKNDIVKEYKDCEDLYYRVTDGDYLNTVINTRNIIYLSKAYSSVDDELQGFMIAESHLSSRDTILCNVFTTDTDRDTQADIVAALTVNLRRDMFNVNKIGFAAVKYLGTDDYVMKNVAVKLNKHVKNIITKLSFSGKEVYNPLTIPLTDISNESYTFNEIGNEAIKLNEEGLRYKDSVILFDSYFNESSENDPLLKKILYADRIKNQKDVLGIYDVVKQQVPMINNTKLNISAYKKNNVFSDTSYYNRAFFENNTYVKDKGLDIYLEFLNRVVNYKEWEKNGYTRQSIIIPVIDWYTGNSDIMDYSKSINPISTIIRTIRTNKINNFGTIGKMDIIFLGKNGYFKAKIGDIDKQSLPRFISNINNIIANSPVESDSLVKDTQDAIVTDIVDKLEKSQNIKLYATGKANTVKEPSTTDKKTDKEVEKEIVDNKKKEIVNTISNAAANSTSVEDTLDNLEKDDYLANLIKDVSDEESNEIKASVARHSRITTVNNNFKQKTVKGKTVKELIEKSEMLGDTEPLATRSININSINSDQWDNLQYINFNNSYDVDEDIMSILNFFSTRTVPVAVRDLKVEDTSTSEDLVETWNVQCEDLYGSRFSLKFDIPKFKNNRFMRLRGNDKIINGQLMNLPIIKTEKDVCQITTNYNKVFFRIFGSNLGKSNVIADMIVKSINKYKGKDISYRLGNSGLASMKYNLPIDYIDLGSNYSTITFKDTTFYFNQEEIRTKFEKDIDLKKGIPIGKSKQGIIYYNGDDKTFLSETIALELMNDKEFETIFNECKPATKYAYTKASIMSTTIPVMVITSYCEGLTKSLKKAGVDYQFVDKRPRLTGMDKVYHDFIKFNDGFLLYTVDYSSSLLMNGLKECNTEDYSVKDVDTKSMWTELLDIFGGRIKADGLDNFYDLLFDPITIRTCEAYDIPSDFCDSMIYASNLLADSKFVKHVDITGNRFRTNELVAGYTYKALSKSYADYRTKLKKTGKSAMSVKQSAIIDAILTDNTSSDASTINDLCYAEANNTVSFKGLSGMNSERSYSLDKRTYDDSMSGLLSMSTGFASTVGENRQATVNMNIQGKRGYIKDTANNKEIMNDVNTLAISEALTPMATTHDDPFREAMSYVQRTKHEMRVAGGDPLLITNGMDDALTNFTPDYFSVNAKQDGKIVERTNDHIVVKYKNGTIDYVDLNNNVYKNSDGGFYTAIKLVPAEKLGTTVKAGQLLAYDPLSYTTNIGYDNNATYNQGTIAKVAILITEKGFEDSCQVNRYISNALSSNVVMKVDINLPKNTNIFNLVKVGQPIEEGEPLLIMQNSFEDDDVNILLKNLVDDEDQVTSLGRIPIRSHNTGVIEDIKIYRTVELDELSSSLKKVVSDYEKDKSRIKKTIEKYDAVKAKEYVNDYKLTNTGKLKNLEEGVKIEIFVSYKDDFSVGDKLILLGAQKGVNKKVFAVGQEPRSEYRPEEEIDCVASLRSFEKRMVTAPLLYCLANKFLIELDRQVKDIMGIKQEYTIHHKELEEKK